MQKNITARYPSNIALVKYWGKYGNQLPCNPSVSLTLQKAFTETKLRISEKREKGTAVAFFFEGKPKKDFGERMLRFLKAQPEFAGLLTNFSIVVDTHNSFPHSAGIASSASAFAAITAAFLKASQTEITDFKQKASSLARLGSGSACRSFYGPFSLWGKLTEIQGSSDQFAVPLLDIHPDFRSMRDTILIVEDAPKKVSSSAGHALMNNHPYADARFKDAVKHCGELISALKHGDFSSFISITEREALSLHAMMMTSKEYYLLMRPQTVQIIEQVFQFRQETQLPLCFTLDAGSSVHLLYPASIQEQVQGFWANGTDKGIKSFIEDESGLGGMII